MDPKASTAIISLIAILLAVAVWHLGAIFQKGRVLATTHDYSILPEKRARITCTGWLMFFTVVLVEILVHVSPNPYTTGNLLLVHWAFDAMLVLSFVAIMFGFDGVHSPRWHKRLVYTLYGTFAAALVTGLTLLYQLLPIQ